MTRTDDLLQLFDDPGDECRVAADIVDGAMVAIEDAIERGDITRSSVADRPFERSLTAFHHGLAATTGVSNTDIPVSATVGAIETAIQREYGDESRVRGE